MKLKLLRPLGFVAIFAISSISLSCNNSTSTEANSEEAIVAEYSCPMKCEKDKTYALEGKCPVCEMDLKKIN
tara:strand:+ start:807 stop:1022 length:216 start_codon:yes stop_codon:yes gene_type:complete